MTLFIQNGVLCYAIAFQERGTWSPQSLKANAVPGKPSEGPAPSTEGRTQISPVLNMDSNNKVILRVTQRVETCGKVQRLMFHYGACLSCCLCPIC